MRIFFDSSAFAKRYVNEKGSEEVRQLCNNASELILSIICLPELISALNRLKRENKITISHYRQIKSAVLADIIDVTICQLNNQTLARAINLLENNTLRAMDALHVACAMVWQVDLFVSADKNQLETAKETKLKIVAV